MENKKKTTEGFDPKVNVISFDATTYKVKGKEYYIPEELTFMQWEAIATLIESSGIQLDGLFNVGLPDYKVIVSRIVIQLFTKRVLGRALAILLVPVGSDYWEKEYLNNADDLGYMTEKDVTGVVTTFLLGRIALMSNLMDILPNIGTQSSDTKPISSQNTPTEEE